MKSYEDTTREVLAARDEYDRKKKVRRKTFTHIAAVAACFVLLLGVVAGGVGIAAAEIEYREAVGFFKDNGLDTEGLTRSQIRSVWRDITSQSFSYDKTGEVLRASVRKNNVEGFELGRPDSEWNMSLHEIWTYYRYNYMNSNAGNGNGGENDAPPFGVRYVLKNSFGESSMIKHLTLSAYDTGGDGERLIFSRSINDDVDDGFAYHTDEYVAVNGGVYLIGEKGEPASSLLTDRTMVVKYSDTGELVFSRVFDHGERFYSLYVTAEENGDLTLILNGGERHAVLRIDGQGNEVFFRSIDGRIGECFEYAGGYIMTVRGDGEYAPAPIVALERLDRDGNLLFTQKADFQIRYLLKTDTGALLITSETTGVSNETSIVALDREGRISSGHSFKSDGRDYQIVSVTEYGGKIWLSCAETVPTDGKTGNPVSDIFPNPYDCGAGQLTRGQLDELSRHIRATLLVCTGDDIEPRVFYTVDGASFLNYRGMCEMWGFPDSDEQFTVTDDGSLAWTVGKITGGSYAPYSGRMPYQLYSLPYTYLFDANGRLVSSGDGAWQTGD